MLRKVGKKKSDMLHTDLIMRNFYKIVAQPLGVLSIEFIVRSRTTKTTFFVIDVITTYNILLGQDWIYSSKCVPSSLHKYLIRWHGDA